MLVRALYEHWLRVPSNSSISNMIKAFLLVQVGKDTCYIEK